MQYDVLVIGAGPAGVAAAISASRAGARTLLVERYGAAGGAFSMGLALTPVGYEPFKYWATSTDPDGWAVQGIARELFDRMVAEDAVCKPVWDVETCKWVMDRLLVDAGVDILFHCRFIDVVRSGARVTGAALATKRGRLEVAAKVTIDCSGDGDVFDAAGCAFDVGREEDGKPQPMLLASIFGNVHLPYTPEMTYPEMMGWSQQNVSPLLDAAWQRGDIPPVMLGIMFPRVVRGGILRDQVWCRLVQHWCDPTDPRAISWAEIETRDGLRKVHDWMRANVPGFENSALLQTSAQTWPREARRLRGVYTLTEDDVRADRKSDLGIAKGTCFLEAHSATPGDPRQEKGLDWKSRESLIWKDVDYDIPYGALVPVDADGILVAGRCISATHIAQSSARMQATSMALGEAAGLAAVLCADQDVAPRDLDVAALRNRLRGQGARV